VATLGTSSKDSKELSCKLSSPLPSSLLNDGARRIILSEVFLTVSNHTAEGEELVEALDIEERFGVEVIKTGPLWESDLLRSMFVDRAKKT